MKSKGRLPWYDHHGVSSEPYIIGISGGSGSGKTSIAQKIINDLGIPWVGLVINVTLGNSTEYGLFLQVFDSRAKRKGLSKVSLH